MLSVIIPTHDPRPDFLSRALSALRAQTLAATEWELLVIDNASATPVAPDLQWHPRARVVREPQLGLTRARVRGFSEALGELAVLVDDDNLLDPGYLAAALEISRAHPFLGAWSGAITLQFEDAAATPPEPFLRFLTTRKVAKAVWSNDPSHNDSTPWGAGLCVRRAVFEAYLRLTKGDPRRAGLDLHGKTLVYGGDTDIAFTGCSIGYGKGVFPSLHLNHLIPPGRCETAYLLNSAEGQAYSEILHGYLLNGEVSGGPRRDLVARLGELARYLRADRHERAVMRAYRRGYSRALSELGSGGPKP